MTTCKEPRWWTSARRRLRPRPPRPRKSRPPPPPPRPQNPGSRRTRASRRRKRLPRRAAARAPLPRSRPGPCPLTTRRSRTAPLQAQLPEYCCRGECERIGWSDAAPHVVSDREMFGSAGLMTTTEPPEMPEPPASLAPAREVPARPRSNIRARRVRSSARSARNPGSRTPGPRAMTSGRARACARIAAACRGGRTSRVRTVIGTTSNRAAPNGATNAVAERLSRERARLHEYQWCVQPFL